MAQTNAPAVGTVEDGYRFKGGDPSNQDAWEQVAPIDVSSQWGAGARQLPNGTIERIGPRGGVTKIQSAADAGSGPALVGADARSRYQIGIGPITESIRSTTAEEARGGNPINNDWGAVLLDGVGIDLPGDNDIRPLGWLAKMVGGQDYQNYTQALATYESSLMPIMSGAAVTPSEARRIIRADFPQLGDSEETVKRKARNRMERLNAIYEGLGREPIFTPEQLSNPSSAFAEQEEAAVAGIGAPEQAVPSDAPKPGDVRTTSQPLAPEDTPNSLSAQGYVYDASTDTWRRNRQEQAPTPEQRGWTPESAVEQRREMNPLLRRIDAGARGFADAAGLEFPDEVAAGADALFGQGVGENIKERFLNNLEVQRAIDRADGEDVGLSRNIGQGLGFAATAGVALPRMLSRAGANLASPILRNAVTGVRNALGGGALAATAAAGQEEGNALERAQAALKAAPVGAAAGVVAPIAVNALARPVIGGLQSAARFTGRQVGRAGEAAGVRGATALRERATPSALDTAVERFAQRMGPQRLGALETNVSRARDLGVDANLVTGLDDASIGRVRALASRDTPSRDLAVNNATATRDRLPSRVRQIADEEISTDARPTIDIIDDLAANRRQNAAAIQEFGADPVDLSDNIVAAMQGNTTRSALRAAADRAGSSLDESERLAEPMLRALADSDGPLSARLSVREVQDISAALRKSADAAYRNGNPEGPILKQLGDAIRQAGRDQSEGYGAWLGRYADDSSLLESATLGRNFVSVSPDPISGRSTDSFVRGATNATEPERVIQRAASRTAMEAAGSSPASARSTLDAAASDVDFYRRADALGVDADRLASRSRAELDNLVRQQRASPRVGSETSLNAQDAAGGAGVSLGDIAGAVVRPGQAVMTALGRRFIARGFSDVEAEALVRAAVDPAMTTELVAMLSQRMSRREARSLARAVQRSVASGQGSSSAQ